MAVTKTNTGLPQTNQRRHNFDIYAIVEAPQELYFGHETRVNVSVVETVRIKVDDNSIVEKCYMSPTKRRGVERRTLIWAATANGTLLGDKLGCGIPHTCTQPDCPICSVYGGLITSDTDVAPNLPGGGKRKANTFIGRLVHGGGVAVQTIEPSEKQRAMHPSMLNKAPSDNPTPMPFKREYNEPALLYPIYNHVLSVSDDEFAAVAYAFLQSQMRLGAGNPKGVRFFDTEWLGGSNPLIVLDRYISPHGRRPTISPTIDHPQRAIQTFCSAAESVLGADKSMTHYEKSSQGQPVFNRWLGIAALEKLQAYALMFAEKHLL